MIRPALLMLIPELLRAALGAWRDHMATRRAEAEAKRLEEERKNTEEKERRGARN